ncbi:AAA family ATPase [Streptomyces scopuliridis]|uniref:helix-turn-helix transcriptional regulator n=1 Tax=Streptomyces scopuliridis TaxID=452529 RepID=UPI0036BBA3D9
MKGERTVIRDSDSGGNSRPAVRSGEAQRLWSALDDLGRGRGRIIEVVGEPGMGKTHLLSCLADEAARRSFTVASSRCTEFERNLPCQVFVQLLGTITGLRSVREESRREATRFRVYDAVRTMLRDRAEQGLVLILDDFHWADTTSQETVEYLLRIPVDAPLLLVVSQRTRQASTRLRSALAHAIDFGNAERIELAPLTVAQSADLLGQPVSSGTLRSLHAASGGNPSRLELAFADKWHESQRPPAVDQPLPERFAAVLAGEIDALAPHFLAVARAAAVIGSRFTLDAIAEVSGIRRDEVCPAVSELIRRDLLRPVSRTAAFTFRYPELRRQIHATFDPCSRASLHRRALAMLARQGAPATEQAVHIEQSLSELTEQDLRTLILAAREELQTSPHQAARWLRVALRVPVSQLRDENEQRDLLGLLTLVLGTGGRLGDKSDLVLGLRRLAPAEPGQARSRVIAFCSLLQGYLGHRAAAQALLNQELESFPGRDVPAAAVPLLVQREVTKIFNEQMPELEQVQLILRAARKHGDRINEAGALALRALTQALTSDPEDARISAEECASVVDSLTDEVLCDHPEFVAMLGWAEGFLGFRTEAAGHFKRGASLLPRCGRTFLRPIFLNGIAFCYVQSNRVSEARAMAAKAKQAALEEGGADLPILALALESWLLLLTEIRGERRALLTAEQAVNTVDASNRPLSVLTTISLAIAARVQGDHPRATALLLTVGGGPDLRDIPPVMRPALYEMLTATAADNSSPSPAEWAWLAASAAQDVTLPMPRAFALMARAHVLHESPAVAADLYQEASCLFSSIGANWAQAWAMTYAASCIAADGRTPEAITVLGYAEELALRAGASRLFENARQLRRELAAFNEEDEKEESAGVLSMLTVREREVAGIVGTGKKTREIAQELSVSPRTVDAHLTRIYRKLNISSRAALARLMAQAS